MEQILSVLVEAGESYGDVYLALLRWIAPAISALLLYRCCKPLLSFRRKPEIWAWMNLPGKKRVAITHWETVIGRSKQSDVVLDYPTVSRNHAVLTRYDDGTWTIADTHSKDGVTINGESVTIGVVEPEDVVGLGGAEFTLTSVSPEQEKKLKALRRDADSGAAASIANVLLLTLLQMLCCLAFLLCGQADYAGAVFRGFAGLAACQWALLLFYFIIRRRAFEVETVAFFLCTMGMAALASVKPWETEKQLLATVLGLVIFLVVGWSMRDLGRAKVMRYLAAAAGIGFLVITLLFGKEYYGAKNWLIIGSFSLQPSELSKVCFVYAGAATMERLMNKRNLILFIGYSIAICACLALMNDFGTALIFFTAFLVIAFLRSGSVGTIALACTSLGFAGVVALKIAPHALRRFSVWRHVWEDPLGAGYQQTRALMCVAAGGLLGVGAGQGELKRVFAADSDIVFATICEEWGLIMALLMVAAILALGLFTVRSAGVARSSFFTIGACTAASIMLVQVILNALGTVDVVPLTGVTFPFVSNGGSSMMCAWGLLAFIKAADTRQNASFAVALPKKRRGAYE